MALARPITIVGGGLAGLTLGIGLRQRGVPVTLWEAGTYPRHRVCGEFISGAGQDVLTRLGLDKVLLDAGAIPARTAAFFLGSVRSPNRPVIPPAWCLSRYKLDALLAEQFRSLGGELLEHTRWQQPDFGAGVVRANGRRPQPTEGGWRWFGLKVHARNVALEADLEMHGLADGYVGICRLAADEANICGLFRRPMGAHSSLASQELLRGPTGTSLHERLDKAGLDESSFCAVAGLALRPRRASAQAECCIGDALTMIPPVTGNGMSIAFESAELAMAPLAAYCQRELSWDQARQRIAAACDQAFAQRLAWARWLQWFMFTPLLRGSPAGLLLHWRFLWPFLFARTR